MPKPALKEISAAECSEEALRLSCRFLAEATNDVILVLDDREKIHFVNPAATQVFGYTPSELSGRKLSWLIPKLMSAPKRLSRRKPAPVPLKQRKQHVSAPGDSHGLVKHLVKHKDGREITVDMLFRELKIAGKAMATVIMRDATHRKDVEEELLASERRYRSVVDSQTDLICRYLPDTTLTFVNDSYCRHFGKTREQLLGSKFLQFIPQSEQPVVIHHIQSLLEESSGKGQLEHQVISPTGEPGWILWITCVTSGEGSRIPELQAIGHDITLTRRLQNSLSRREREFSTLVENSRDIISRLDRNLQFSYVSPTVQSLFGVRPQHFIGKTTREVGLHSHDWRGFEKACQRVFTSGTAESREYQYGGNFYLARIIPEFTDTGTVESVLCIDQDVSEQRRAEEELRTLSSRLLDLQERERRRIARELHDGTAQNLFAMSIGLSRLLPQAMTPDFKSHLEECLSLCEQSRQEIRTLSYLLHPPMLDEAGLVSALKWYIEGFSERSGIKVDLVVEKNIGRLQIEIETVLFRVVQECLANVHRHSGSTLASVKLERQSDRIVLQVQDWGHGIPSKVSRAGVGIPGMRERISQLFGHLDIESSSQGTTITATIPLTSGMAAGATRSSGKQKPGRSH